MASRIDTDTGEIGVLLVDDDREWAKFTAGQMEGAESSVSVTVATSGEAALEAIDAGERVDCLVVDYRMPGMDGVDVLNAVREDHPRLPVILVTGSGSEDLASDAIGSGATDYIVKDPMANQAPELVSRVEQSVENYRLRQALSESERRYRTVVEESHDAVAILRGEDLVFWNERLTALTGREESTLGETEFLDVIHDGDTEQFSSALGDGMESTVGEGLKFDARIVRPDGDVRECEFNCTGIVYDGAPATLCSIRDVTERKRRERELSRALSIKRAVQDIAVQSNSRSDIEMAFCRQLVEEDERPFAWIGESTDEGVLEPRAVAGDDGGYLDAVELGLGKNSADPSAAAADTQEAQFVGDVASGEGGWRAVALEHGVRSVGALPVIHDEVFYGVLAVYADESGAFGGPEQELLIDLADTLATSIHRAELRTAMAADRVVEVRLELTDRGHYLIPPVQVVGEGDSTTVEVLETLPREAGSVRQLLSVADDAGSRLREALVDRDRVRSVAPVTEGETESVIRVDLDGPTPEVALADHGGFVRETTVTGREATLVVEFAENRDVRSVIENLEDAFGPVSIRRYQKRERKQDLSSALDSCGLTDKQARVLKTAYRSGYFGKTRSNYAEDIADAMDISRATFHTHLRTAQRKIFGTLLDESVPVEE